jgi:hypothetical protein
MAYTPIMPNMKLTAADMGAPDYADALRKGFQASADVYKPSTAASTLLAKMLENKINQPKAQDAQGWYDLQKQALSSRNMLYGAQAQQAMMDYMQNKAFYDALNGGGSSDGAASSALSYSDSGYSDRQPNLGAQPGIDNSSNPGVSYEGPGANYGEPTVANTFPGRTGRPIAQTQPQLQPYVSAIDSEINNQSSSMQSNGRVTTLSPGSSSMYQIDDLYDKNPLARIGFEKRGLKKTQIVKVDPSTGNTSIITTYPSGKVESRMVESNNNLPFKKEMAKEDAKILSGIETAALSAGDQLTALDGLSDILGGKIFTEMRQNPLYGKYELEYFAKAGTPEQQEQVGQFMSYAGEIVKRASTDFKGQFRKGEQELLEGMKPTMSDSIDVAKGKVQALNYLLQKFKQRSELESDFMRSRNMGPIKARQSADLLINSKQIKQDINKKLYPVKHASVDELIKKAGGQ